MGRYKILAFLFVALLATGCPSHSKDGGPGDSDEKDDGDKKPRGDGGIKTDAKVPNRDAGRDTGTDGPGNVMPAPGEPYMLDNTGESGLSDKDIDELRAGGGACAKDTILYPYDETTYPVGLPPPSFMFSKPTQAAYLKLTYAQQDHVLYETAAKGSDPGQLDVPAEHWTEVLRHTGKTMLQATVSVKIGGKVQTCNYKFKVAQGAMIGTLYYNTYNHPDKNGMGAIVRLPLGSTKPEIYLSYEDFPPAAVAGPCTSCHTLSFNGSTMTASTHNYNPGLQSQHVSSFKVTADVQPKAISRLPEATFAAMTPKGDKLLTMGNPDCTTGADTFPRSPNNFPLLKGPADATLHSTADGSVIASKGLSKDHYMWMPQFSPDGDMVVFNDAKPAGGSGGTNRRDLAIMKFDDSTNTFSDLQVLVSKQGPEPSIDYAPLPTLSFGPINSDCPQKGTTGTGPIPHGACTGPCYPAWPFFTPDGKGVVYAMVTEPDFLVAMPGRSKPAQSELWYVDIDSKESVRLDAANAGPKPEDALVNYFPTVLPVAVGGYYWIFWTSTRDWGHHDINATPEQILKNAFTPDTAAQATRKRIWVSALRPRRMQEGGLEPLSDTSSPPFYLEGQTSSGNIRAFAALNPCKTDNAECTVGIDCCSGFCRIEEGQTKGVCVPKKDCADINEKCDTDANCCKAPAGEQERLCIGGYCNFRLL